MFTSNRIIFVRSLLSVFIEMYTIKYRIFVRFFFRSSYLL
nr:MAG TPA: hypothetical protein [Caudoviricetes sp.]